MIDLIFWLLNVSELINTYTSVQLSQGPFGAYEDKKHRATYEALDDPEKKFRFFSARQIACRLLGSRGYLCQKVLRLLFLNCCICHE